MIRGTPVPPAVAAVMGPDTEFALIDSGGQGTEQIVPTNYSLVSNLRAENIELGSRPFDGEFGFSIGSSNVFLSGNGPTDDSFATHWFSPGQRASFDGELVPLEEINRRLVKNTAVVGQNQYASASDPGRGSERLSKKVMSFFSKFAPEIRPFGFVKSSQRHMPTLPGENRLPDAASSTVAVSGCVSVFDIWSSSHGQIGEGSVVPEEDNITAEFLSMSSTSIRSGFPVGKPVRRPAHVGFAIEMVFIRFTKEKIDGNITNHQASADDIEICFFQLVPISFLATLEWYMTINGSIRVVNMPAISSLGDVNCFASAMCVHVHSVAAVMATTHGSSVYAHGHSQEAAIRALHPDRAIYDMIKASASEIRNVYENPAGSDNDLLKLQRTIVGRYPSLGKDRAAHLSRLIRIDVGEYI